MINGGDGPFHIDCCNDFENQKKHQMLVLKFVVVRCKKYIGPNLVSHAIDLLNVKKVFLNQISVAYFFVKNVCIKLLIFGFLIKFLIPNSYDYF